MSLPEDNDCEYQDRCASDREDYQRFLVLSAPQPRKATVDPDFPEAVCRRCAKGTCAALRRGSAAQHRDSSSLVDVSLYHYLVPNSDGEGDSAGDEGRFAIHVDIPPAVTLPKGTPKGRHARSVWAEPYADQPLDFSRGLPR